METTVPPPAEWRLPVANIRLRIAPASRRNHLLRIDLPAGCPPECRAAAAFLSQGDQVPCSPVFLRDQLVAVECLVPWQGRGPFDTEKKSQLPLEVYLLPGAEVPLPVPAAERKPVCLRRALRKLTTRPFTSEEVLRMIGSLRDLLFASRDMQSFSGALPMAAWSSPPGRTTAILHWNADLLVNADTELRFGADQDTVAWFFFLDGTPAADWKNGRRLASGARMSPATRLATGFHRLDLFAFQGQDEPIPQLLYSEPNAEPKPLPPERLYDADYLEAVLMERKDGGPGIGLRFRQLARLRTVEPAQDFLVFTVDALGVDPASAAAMKYTLRIGDRIRDGIPNDVVEAVAGNGLPALSLTRTAAGAATEFNLPPRRIWLPPALIRAELSVRHLPTVLPADRPLCADIEAALPGENAAQLVPLVLLRQTQKDAAGNVLDRQTVPLPKDTGRLPLNLTLNEKVARVELDLAVQDTPLLPPVCVRLIRPGDDLGGLQALQRSLRTDGDHAVLLSNPLAPLLPAPPSTRTGQPPANTAETRTVAILDDFWAISTGPDADLLPEQCLSKPGTNAVTRFSVFDGTDGAVGELRKFAVLPRALAVHPTVLVCAVGACELRAAMKPEEMALHLLFLAQAAHAAGAVPVLVTLPPLPGIDRHDIRLAALLTKELAFRLGIPVVDTYSRTVQENGDAPGFEARFLQAGGGCSLATPDNAGREWLCRQVEAALAAATENTSPP
ncbi:MAG: hypothetical protein A3K19_17485 [Lentisphaerae bacterium RIFOXYB12_FULL_65_16]|nr:MAG: hypothetical protein A3K18_12470 [Lentisphaerae bacterium RIFOXYA12_64_32]OGV85593.1 MAG: hypothetical protein A3K19_17485 [Lentisphaerae bacterium RIFOXYB12_FULL_65_16]